MIYMKNFRLFESVDITYKDWDYMFLKIRSYPVKYKLPSYHCDWRVEDTNGLDGFNAAICRSEISKFYFGYLRMKNKRSYILNIPDDIDKTSYDKIFEITKYIDSVYIQTTGATSLLSNNTASDWKIKAVLLYLKSNMSTMLIYEEYFGGTKIHDFVNNQMVTPSNLNDIFTLYDQILDRNKNIISNIIKELYSQKNVFIIHSFTESEYGISKDKVYKRFDL